MEIASLLNPEYEWYDNSTLDTIDLCIRKAYWKILFTLPGAKKPGVGDRVGVAAHYGSSIHSAMDKMYSPILYKTMTLEQRKLAAFRAFTKTYASLISDEDHELIDDKYSHPRGIETLSMYFDHYEEEDQLFIPVETELCMVLLLEELDPPAYWICREDGLLFRPSQDDYLVREFKTTSSSIQQKLDELRISRQCEGYVTISREFDSDKYISGIMADVIGVRVKEKEPTKLFGREIFHVTPTQCSQWRTETIQKIERWRRMKKEAERKLDLGQVHPLNQHHLFDRFTQQCMRYGKCSYYDLCVHGLNAVDLSTFLPNDWNPLYADKMEG